MAKTIDQAASLKEACVQAAREVIAERGVENLSMRDVARKLSVSHQAPYRHFESRDHLLAEIMRRCFVDFGISAPWGRRISITPNSSPSNTA
jgi:AcrR family transcriptional regulator